MRKPWIVLVVTAALAGCGGPRDEAEEPGGRGAAGGETPAGPGATDEGKPSAIELLGISGPEEKPWAEMSYDEREYYMVGKVLPISEEIFRKFDAAEFAEFGCEGCHGEKGEEREFAMPTDELPIVPEPGSNGYDLIKEGNPEMVAFMEDEVTPTVQTLLGEEQFGCNDCHPSP